MTESGEQVTEQGAGAEAKADSMCTQLAEISLSAFSPISQLLAADITNGQYFTHAGLISNSSLGELVTMATY